MYSTHGGRHSATTTHCHRQGRHLRSGQRLVVEPSVQVSLFEAGLSFGGPTNTVDIPLRDRTHSVDTGFLVFNEKTYPNMITLFALLGVDGVETERCFPVGL